MGAVESKFRDGDYGKYEWGEKECKYSTAIATTIGARIMVKAAESVTAARSRPIAVTRPNCGFICANEQKNAWGSVTVAVKRAGRNGNRKI
ncbi:MAG: hypothetical protein FWH17_09705 [Oscillospiraceae bacterium]|nr:hypothetical protein [Oscillospiraceae bacterium]